MMTFFSALHFSLGGKLDIGGRDDFFLAENWTFAGVMIFFFALHYIRPCSLGFKLRPPPPFQFSRHARGRDDLFYFVSPRSAALDLKIFSNSALRAKSLLTPDQEDSRYCFGKTTDIFFFCCRENNDGYKIAILNT